MAFFDDLEKKITEAGQSAVQKTKDHNEISKLQNSINSQNTVINKNYTEIGKLYYSLHKEDFGEEYAEMFTSINDALKVIDENKARIRELKGLVLCKGCGAEIPEDSTKCAVCGAPGPKPEPAPVPAPVAEAPVRKFFCYACGKELKEGLKFCTSCGTAVIVPPAPEAEPVAEEVVPEVIPEAEPVVEEVIPEVIPEAEPVVEEVIPEAIPETEPVVEEVVPEVIPVDDADDDIPLFCENCGSKLEEDAIFCTECGYRVR